MTTPDLRSAAHALVDEWDAAMRGDMPLDGHYQKQAVERLRAALASQSDGPDQRRYGPEPTPSQPEPLDVDRLALILHGDDPTSGGPSELCGCNAQAQRIAAEYARLSETPR